MNLKRIEADTDPGEPLTDEEAEWMLRSEERDGGEYVSMTERGGGPAEEVAKVGLETNDLVEVVAEVDDSRQLGALNMNIGTRSAIGSRTSAAGLSSPLTTMLPNRPQPSSCSSEEQPAT